MPIFRLTAVQYAITLWLHEHPRAFPVMPRIQMLQITFDYFMLCFTFNKAENNNIALLKGQRFWVFTFQILLVRQMHTFINGISFSPQTWVIDILFWYVNIPSMFGPCETWVESCLLGTLKYITILSCHGFLMKTLFTFWLVTIH